MTGIGASSYGATDINFTYFDMANYLYELGIYGAFIHTFFMI